MYAELLHAVQSIARSLQPQFWPPTITDILQAVLVLLTFVTVCLLWRYTKATLAVLRATRDQVNATNLLVHEAQQQNEQSLMPILVLTLQGNQGVFTVKNVGNGPALNIWIQPFSHGETESVFHHSNAIGAGEQDEPVLRIGPNGTPLTPEDFKSAITKALSNDAGPDVAFHTKLSYDSATRRRYQTSHTIKRTPGKYDAIIQFDGFRQTSGPVLHSSQSQTFL